MTPPRRRRALPARGTVSDAVGGSRGVATICSWEGCSAAILWLAYAGENKAKVGRLAPIDAEPAPGGNVEVDRPAGTYRVIGDPAQRSLLDPTLADPDARPTLHLNHWTTCSSPTARRLARERAGSGRGKLVTVDGDPVHPAPDELCSARFTTGGGAPAVCVRKAGHQPPDAHSAWSSQRGL